MNTALLAAIALLLAVLVLLALTGRLRGPAGPQGPSGPAGRDAELPRHLQLVADAKRTGSGAVWEVLTHPAGEHVKFVREGTPAWREAYDTPGLAVRLSPQFNADPGVQ